MNNDEYSETLTQTKYYPDGKLKSDKRCKWNGHQYELRTSIEYDQNGNIVHDYSLTE